MPALDTDVRNHVPAIVARWRNQIPVALLLAGALVYGIAIASIAAYAVGGSDSAGYANIARGILSGRFVETIEMLNRLALPDEMAQLFLPLAYTAGPRPRTMTPFYPVGYPLHLAVAALLGGWRRAPFWISPVAAALSLIFIYLVGRELRLTRSLAGAAAVVLALCPIFVFQAQQPMSDVVATCWTLVAVWAGLAARRHAGWALLSGAAFGIGVLVRPTNALLLVPLLFALPASRRAWLSFVLGGAPAAAVFFAYNAAAYGSLMQTGYGAVGLTTLITPRGFIARFYHYVYWLSLTMSPLPLILWLGIGLDRRARWRERALVISWFGIFFLFYCCYEVYQEWWYTRFLLPAIPALILGSLIVVCDLSGWARQRSLEWIGASALVAFALAFAVASEYRSGILEIGRGQNAHRISCRRADQMLPPSSLVVAMEMSGALKYYTGRPTLRWDYLKPEDWSLIKGRAREAGSHFAALLLPHELEQARPRVPGRWTKIDDVQGIGLWEIEPE